MRIPKTKAGRPKLEFDLKQVELMGYFKATQETMASYLECSIETIKRNMAENEQFSAAYKKGNSRLCLKLSESQIKLAIDKLNPTMLIWLGKQYLNQREPSFLTEDDGNKFNDLATLFGKALVQVAGAGRIPSDNNQIQE
jgi:hypothetical protein